jgi:ABC-type nitrate/sulfonate/bicarbonate transport system ATPase subunit
MDRRVKPGDDEYTFNAPQERYSTGNMAEVHVDNVSKLYFSIGGEPVLALHEVSFQVRHNEFFSIVGPSGCGKTTLLNLLAGFEQPTRGAVRLGNKQIAGPGWERAVVFQEYALFPWYTVAQNIAYGLKRKRVPEPEQRRIVDHYLDLVGLSGSDRRYPRELSGGMRQRVSIARALAVNPSILLMDEPFASLDVQTREYMQDELLKIWQAEPKTVIFVTHSIDEAIKLSDRIAIMTSTPGRVKEIMAVKAPRPRDATDPGMVRLAAEVKDWLRHQVEATEHSTEAALEHSA